jgi:2'-5' RNA ligase
VATDRTSETKPFRLFVAVGVPDEVADLVEEALEPWRRALPDVRWTPRGNWHVTLRFLGSTDPRSVPWIGDRLAEVASDIAPFERGVRGLGAFPSARRAKVLWAGFEDDDGSLARLAGAVADALDPRFPAEERPFGAHMTVARSARPIRLPAGFATTPLEDGRLAVDALKLMRSHLGRSAPVHEELAAFRLSGRRERRRS